LGTENSHPETQESVFPTPASVDFIKLAPLKVTDNKYVYGCSYKYRKNTFTGVHTNRLYQSKLSTDLLIPFKRFAQIRSK